MEELIHNFGIQPVLLVAQIINFLIIFWLLAKFAYKPIFTVLEKRKKLIEEGVKNAQDSELTLEKALVEEKNILKKAHTQSQEILLESQKQAQEMLSHAELSAKERVEKIMVDAKKEIAKQTEEAEKRLVSQTAKIAVEILEKSLKGMVDDKTQKEVLEKVTKKIKK